MGPPYTPPSLTEKQYEAELEIVDSEIYEANYYFQVMEGVNDAVLGDESVRDAINETFEQGEFWQAHRAATQAAMFMALWRVFDDGEKAKSITRLIRLTRENLHIFSRDALAARKRGPSNFVPPWHQEFMKQTWQPATAEDLKYLKTALKPHAALFRRVYEPIRHHVYAHRLIGNREAAGSLFTDTNRAELGGVIRFLQVLVSDLSDLYLNGRKPTLDRDLTAGNSRIREAANRVVRRFAGNTLPDKN